MGDRHENCINSEMCLCADNNHGVERDAELIKMISSNDDRDFTPANEPREYEKSRHDAERLEDMIDNGIGQNSPHYAIIEYLKLLICSKHLVSKFDLVNESKEWCIKYHIPVEIIDESIEVVFSDMDVFQNIKTISNSLGVVKKETLFDKTQLIEVSEWLKGRYFLKRIEVTGDLLFFNGEYYERDAEALIRREARKCIAKSKNTDINEIVKLVEDTCHVITWKHIEASVHLKCLTNGIYDIKNGVFCSVFNPDYIILNQIPHNYNELATYEEIDKTVLSITKDKTNSQTYYDALSTCLHPFTGVDFQLGCVGIAGSGKSQLSKLAEYSLGDENVSHAGIHNIANDQTTQKDCAFKMLNIDEDLSNEAIKHIDTLKKWITQDKFTARGIYEHSSTFKPTARLMFMANDLYEIANEDDAEAIYDRSHIIKINNKFRGQKTEVKRVMEKVCTKEQLEGFITYLLKNATWIYENNNIHHPQEFITTQETWNMFGNRVKQFVEKWVVKGMNERVEHNEVFNKWLGFCAEKKYRAKDKKSFVKVFDEIVQSTPTKTRRDGIEVYSYSGFRLKTDEELAKEETTPLNTEALKALYFFDANKLIEISKNIIFNQKNIELIELLGMSHALVKKQVCDNCSNQLEFSKLKDMWMCFSCQDEEIRDVLKKPYKFVSDDD